MLSGHIGFQTTLLQPCRSRQTCTLSSSSLCCCSSNSPPPPLPPLSAAPEQPLHYLLPALSATRQFSYVNLKVYIHNINMLSRTQNCTQLPQTSSLGGDYLCPSFEFVGASNLTVQYIAIISLTTVLPALCSCTFLHAASYRELFQPPNLQPACRHFCCDV